MNGGFFSISRWLGIVGKEFIQLKRDRLTFAMIVGIPVVQLVMFGYAINSDPKRLPTALLVADRSEFSRSILAGLQNSRYFEFVGEARNEDDADRMLAMGEAQFVVTIPADFSRRAPLAERNREKSIQASTPSSSRLRLGFQSSGNRSRKGALLAEGVGGTGVLPSARVF